MIRKIIYYTAAVMFIASCSKQSSQPANPAPNFGLDKNSISLGLAPQSLDDASLTFSPFEENDDIRLGVYYRDETTHKLTEYAGVDNTKIFGKLKMKSDGSGTAWRFGYDYEGDLVGVGFKVELVSGKNPFVAGCAPYTDAEDIQSISYDIANCKNYMYLDPVEVELQTKVGETGEKELTEFNYDVDLKYRHTLAKLEIRIQNKQQIYSAETNWAAPFGSYPRFFYLMPLENNKLLSTATIDATTGVYSNLNYFTASPEGKINDADQEKLTLTTLRIIERDDDGVDISYYKTGLFKYDLYVYPIDDLGEGVRLAMGYSYLTKELDEELGENQLLISKTSLAQYYTDIIDNPKLIINKDMIKSGKIEAGHKYRIEIDIDNYYKVTDVVVDTQWADSTATPFVGEL